MSSGSDAYSLVIIRLDPLVSFRLRSVYSLCKLESACNRMPYLSVVPFEPVLKSRCVWRSRLIVLLVLLVIARIFSVTAKASLECPMLR